LLRRVYMSLAVLAGVLGVGTVGYVLIEHLSLLDALYMTVITVATVGYGEVAPLDEAGKIFTIALIFAGIGALGFSFGTFVDFLVEGHLRGLLEEHRMMKRIDGMSGHHIVCGMGRVGTEVVRQLEVAGADFVVIDKADECIERARDLDWPIVAGDASDETNLRAAGIERAKSLVAALDTDADNVYVALTARTLAPEILIVARATAETSEHKLRRAGADRVLTPTVIGGRRMASMVLHPFVTDYLDLVTHGHEFEFRLEELELPQDSSLAGKTIGQAGLHDRFGVFVLAVHHPEGTVDASPKSDSVLRPGDMVILLGSGSQLEALTASL
jgi:voltage-gated potassium channel